MQQSIHFNSIVNARVVLVIGIVGGGAMPTPLPEDIPSPGSRVSHYEIRAEIGRGGMGVVFRAHDVELGRDVALKFPWITPQTDEVRRRRFLREARTSSRLIHPHIVAVLEVFEAEHLPCMVLEYVDGPDLRSLVQERGPLPVLEVLRHGEALADALRFAHGKGVLHHDITPRNVLIGSDGRARLTDFGLAQVMRGGPADSAQLTVSETGSKDGTPRGTPAYMSPEQALGRPIDVRSDIYSLGAVLYEMCTGVQAVSTSVDVPVLESILHREPAPFARYNAEMPPEIERIVRKAMAKRIDERYQNIDDMIVDLRALRRNVEHEDVIPAPPRSGHRLAWWLTCVALFAALGAGGVGIWRWRHRELPSPIPAAHPRQLTRSPGAKGEPAISPDGKFVAYASDESDGHDIWLLEVKGGGTLRLTDSPGAKFAPVWYPDGGSIAYWSNRDGVDAIMKVPMLGGDPVLLVPDAREPALSPDGQFIAFSRTDEHGLLRIAVAPISDVTRARFLSESVKGVWDHRRPAWSPDGQFLCFEDFRDLWIVPVAGGTPAPLTTDHQGNAHPVWSSDGRSIYFSSSREGTQAIWRMPRAGGTAERITAGSGPESQPDMDPAGRRLVYSTASTDSVLALFDVDTQKTARFDNLRDLTSPFLAPNGKDVYFVSERSGRSELWLQSVLGGQLRGDAHRVAETPGPIGTYSISRDGKWIAYHGTHDGRRDIWVMPSSGAPPRRVTSDDAIHMHPAWSWDGKWLAYVSDASGSNDVWVSRIENGELVGEPRRLTRGTFEASFPSWSPDGRSIAFGGWRKDGNFACVVQVANGEVTRLMGNVSDVHRVVWDARRGDLLVAAFWGATKVEVRRVSPTGAVTPFVPPLVVGHELLQGDFTESWDGRTVAFEERRSRGDLWLLEAKSGRF